MILSSAIRAYVYSEAVDMRKSIDGMSQIVAAAMGMNPLSGQVSSSAGAVTARSSWCGIATDFGSSTSVWNEAASPTPRDWAQEALR